MVKNAKTLIGAGLIVVIGIVLVIVGPAIPGAIVALVGIGALFFVLRLPAEHDGADDEYEDEAPAPGRRTSTAVAEPETDSLTTWEADGEGLTTWEADSGSSTTWEADSGDSTTWEADSSSSTTWETESESLTSWETDADSEPSETWGVEETTSMSWDGTSSTEDESTGSFETESDSFDTFESLSFGEEEAESAPSGGGGLFSVPSPIDEDVHSDDDIMAASQATELAIVDEEAAGEADNSELAKLLAKVQSRLAAYE